MRERDLLALLLHGHARHGLAEAEPAARVCLLAHRVVAFGAEAHRQHVVGKPRRLAPDRRERDVHADLRFVAQHFHPREAVGIRPQRVVDAREVGVELAAPFLQEVRQQEAHLEEREREFLREEQFVPVVGRRRGIRVLRDELVRHVQVHAARLADRAHQHDEQIQAARDLPAPEMAGGRRAPAVRGERRAGVGDGFGRFDHLRRGHARFGRRVLGRELGVFGQQRVFERLERARQIRPARSRYASQFTQRRTKSRL